MIADGTVSGGMIPKLRSAAEGVSSGIGKVHLIDGRLRHALLLEIFTDRGIGTQIVP
jgi:acetylglutamate kinase